MPAEGPPAAWPPGRAPLTLALLSLRVRPPEVELARALLLLSASARSARADHAAQGAEGTAKGGGGPPLRSRRGALAVALGAAAAAGAALPGCGRFRRARLSHLAGDARRPPGSRRRAPLERIAIALAVALAAGTLAPTARARYQRPASSSTTTSLHLPPRALAAERRPAHAALRLRGPVDQLLPVSASRGLDAPRRFRGRTSSRAGRSSRAVGSCSVSGRWRVGSGSPWGALVALLLSLTRPGFPGARVVRGNDSGAFFVLAACSRAPRRRGGGTGDGALVVALGALVGTNTRPCSGCPGCCASPSPGAPEPARRIHRTPRLPWRRPSCS